MAYLSIFVEHQEPLLSHIHPRWSLFLKLNGKMHGTFFEGPSAFVLQSMKSIINQEKEIDGL